MAGSAKRRPQQLTPIEIAIGVGAELGDPPELIARSVGLSVEEVERRLRLPHMVAYLEHRRRIGELSHEERLERLMAQARELVDDYLRKQDTTGLLPN